MTFQRSIEEIQAASTKLAENFKIQFGPIESETIAVTLPFHLFQTLSDLTKREQWDIANRIGEMIRAEAVAFIESGGAGRLKPLAPVTVKDKLKKGYPLTPLVRSGYLKQQIARMPIEVVETEKGLEVHVGSIDWLAEEETPISGKVYHKGSRHFRSEDYDWGKPHGGLADQLLGARSGRNYKVNIPARRLKIPDIVALEDKINDLIRRFGN